MAYDLVHSGLKPAGASASKQSNRERVLSLRAKGLTQVEIAAALGVSRQAVSKAVKKIAKIIDARTVEQYLDPATGEVAGAKRYAVQARQLRSKKFSDQEIASRLGLFKHTVNVLLKNEV